MKQEFINQLILIELDRATRQHPEWPDDIIHAAGIIVEEAGELMKACLDLVYFGGDERSIRNEIVSVAAMAVRFMLHFPEYYSHIQAKIRLFEDAEKGMKFKRKEGKD